ncbi:MAG TPA: PPOX class F420-dependent oxidoreductase [Nitrosarchaeum sp.]|jgi:PPOX class probable F420-dependent enzyme|nr:PPOX class F420-dependent oxidoreductase [Nitrosarchaeum sp.]
MDIFPNERYIALETFRNNGTPVRTPVWFVEYNGLIWIITRELTGKVKRIRNNNKVNIAISNFSGKPNGKWFSGKADLIQGDLAEKIISLRNKKYGFMAKMIGFFSAKKGKYVVYSLKLD